MERTLIANGPIILNPARILWANIEAELPLGTGVQIQFDVQPSPCNFYNGDAQSAAAILLASAVEAPNA